MVRELGILREAIQRLEAEPDCLGFEVRAHLERGIYGTARSLSRTYLHHNLVGFSLAAREQLERLRSDAHGMRDVLQTLDLAFELKAVLAILASGNPYLQMDLLEPRVQGKRAVLDAFIRRLRGYARRIERLMERSSADGSRSKEELG